MEVVAGPASPLLASRVADKLNSKVAQSRYKKFPDGELYARVECNSQDAVVVQSVNSNDDLIFLMLTLEALEDKNVTAVVPYLGYARQDKRFMKGEALSIRVVARMIEDYADKVLSVNIHSEEAKKQFENIEEVDAMPVLGKHFKGEDICMISPDVGAYGCVKVAAQSANCDFDYLEKKRLDAEHVAMETKNMDVKDKRAVLIDDIISTGGTIVEATKILLEQGAQEVKVGCVHPVFASYALNRLYTAGVSEVIATDTIERNVSEISAAGLIAKALK